VARPPHIFRWDLDKTYLATEFDTLLDLVRTARLTAEQRENIPGSAAMIRAIRDDPDTLHQIFFLSGSPSQMRKVLEQKFALDGFVPDGFVLKPTLGHIVRGRFRAVRGQVPYKLEQLLIGRSEVPVGASETLFGDDAESDAFIYSLYADVVAGRVDPAQLSELLRKCGAYPDQIRLLEDALESVVREDPVQRIVIHLDQSTPPAAFAPYFPRVVPIYNHLQTAFVLYLDGALGPKGIRMVGRELLARYGFNVERLVNLAEDILRRRRQHHPLDFLEQTIVDVRSLVGLDDPGSDLETDEVRTQLNQLTDDLLAQIADRAATIRASTQRPPEPPAEAAIDYFAQWEAEEERARERKRIKKLAAPSESSAPR